MFEKLIITIVCDNYTDKPMLKSMHGFSCFIEYRSQKIVFDTGQKDDFSDNLKNLGLDDLNIDKIVLSHGHYDHTGGLKFLPRDHRFEIFAHKNIFFEHLKKQNGDFKNIGLGKNDIHSNLNFNLTAHKTELSKDIYLSGSIKRIYNIERDENLFCKKDGIYLKDTFEDEIYLAVDTENGLVIVTGCSHAGIENIIEDAENKFSKHIYAIVGGLHLFRTSREDILNVANFINIKNIDRVVTGHCTGLEATGILQSVLGDKVSFSKVGEKIYF